MTLDVTEDVTTPADVARLESLYRSMVRRVHGYARNRVGADDAADIVAEVFHGAALAIREGRGDAVTESWVMAVAHNKVMDHWRRSYRRKAKAHLVEHREDELVDFPVDWSEDPRREFVIAALDRLNDRDRGLLIVHHVDGMPIDEMAATTGKSVAAIESALARARRRFRTHYRGENNGQNKGAIDG